MDVMGEVVSAPVDGTMEDGNDGGAVNDGSHVGMDVDSTPAEIKQHILDVAASVPQPQPLEHIVGSTPSKQNNKGESIDKSCMNMPLCYPWGMPNVEEQMIVVTPDDDISLYQDAVDTVSYEKLKADAKKAKKKKKKSLDPHHNDVLIIDRKVIMEQLPKTKMFKPYRDMGEETGEYVRPGSYIYYIEKTPEEDMNQIEYDMDSEDEVWLEKCNKIRKSDGLRPVTDDHFEMIFDRLEKETFKHQTKVGDFTVATIITPTVEIDPNDVCCVCFDGTSDDTNQIVYCDGCNIAIHQECYGIPLIPELQWFCQKCESENKKHVSCFLCGGKDGAIKRTVDGDWAHILCVQWIPEISSLIDIGVGKERIAPSGFKHRVPKARWKLTCSICKRKVGACIQCRERICTTAFHVTCVRKQSFQLGVRPPTVGCSDDEEYEPLTSLDWGFCEKHLQIIKPRKILKHEESSSDSSDEEDEAEEKELEGKVQEANKNDVKGDREITPKKRGRKKKKRRYSKSPPKPLKQKEENSEGVKTGKRPRGRPRKYPLPVAQVDAAKLEEQANGELAEETIIKLPVSDDSVDVKQEMESEIDEDKAQRDAEDQEIADAPIGNGKLDETETGDVKYESDHENETEDKMTLDDKADKEADKQEERKEQEEHSEQDGQEEQEQERQKLEQEEQEEEGKQEQEAQGEREQEAQEEREVQEEESEKDEEPTRGKPGRKRIATREKKKTPNRNLIESYFSKKAEGEDMESEEEKKTPTKQKKKGKKPATEDDSAEGGEEEAERELPGWYDPARSNSSIREMVTKNNLVPLKIAQKVIKAPSQAVASIFPYWVQKRSSRSGVPLLKRFQVSILASYRKEGKVIAEEKDPEECLEDMKEIRHDLERVRILLELIKKRERAKKALVDSISAFFELTSDPITHNLTYALDLLQREDKKGAFMYPISDEFVPGYSEVIKSPMDFETMRQKLSNSEYTETDKFWSDAKLIFDNAKTFNLPKTAIYRDADHLQQFLDELKSHFDADTLLSFAPAKDANGGETHQKHYKKKKSRWHHRKSHARPKRALGYAFGEEEGQEQEGEDGGEEEGEGEGEAEEEEEEEEEGENGASPASPNGFPDDSSPTSLDTDETDSTEPGDEPEPKRQKLGGGQKRPRKPIPEGLIPRRSGRNKEDSEDDAVAVPDELSPTGRKRSPRKPKDDADQQTSPVKSSPTKSPKSSPIKQIEITEVPETQDTLKSSLKLGKMEWYSILDVLEKEDSEQLFLEPVEKMVPDYKEYIDHPMCFETMRKKVKAGKYNQWDSFWNDVHLIFDNSISFNGKKSVYVTEAVRLHAFAKELEMTELGKKTGHYPEAPSKKRKSEHVELPEEEPEEAKLDDKRRTRSKATTPTQQKQSTTTTKTPAPSATRTTPSSGKRVVWCETPPATVYFDKNERASAVGDAAKAQKESPEESVQPATKKQKVDKNTPTSNDKELRRSSRDRTPEASTPKSTSHNSALSPTSPIPPLSFDSPPLPTKNRKTSNKKKESPPTPVSTDSSPIIWSARRRKKKAEDGDDEPDTPSDNTDTNNNNNNNNNSTNKRKQSKIDNYFSKPKHNTPQDVMIIPDSPTDSPNSPPSPPTTV